MKRGYHWWMVGFPYPDAESDSESDSDSLLVLLSFQPSSKFRGGGVSDYYFVWRRVVMPFYPGQDP